MSDTPDTPRRVADPGSLDPAGSPSPGGSGRRVAGHSSFGQAAGWTILGILIPGLGLIRSGRRVLGTIALSAFVLLVGGGLTLLLTQPKLVQSFVLQPNALESIAIGMLVIGVLLVLLVGLTHLALRPANPGTGQRVAGGLLVAALSFLVAAPMAVGASYAWTTAKVVGQIFEDDPEPEPGATTEPTIPVDPWADQDQVNFLILGGDSGNNRSSRNGDRTDTVIVASVDTHTGATTLFTLPRNTAKMPFPKDSPLRKYYPNGFYDGSNPANAEYMLNAMYRNVPTRVPHDILGKKKDFGAAVMKESVGEALGLKIDYFVKVNMDGFKDFINAIGGVRLNINYRIPIGGQTDEGVKPSGYLEPAKNKKLNGRLALWYARGRYGLDDYKRMERQRCVINAVVQQTTPMTVLQNYQAIAAAGGKTITTDVPRKMLPALLDLAEKVQGTSLRSVVFTPGTAGFYSSNPNWDKVRSRVKTALKETAKGIEPEVDPTADPSATPGASATPSAKPTKKPKKNKSDDLDYVCGYHPEK